jgi:uncharacterized protein YbjT (DUF2867 family)
MSYDKILVAGAGGEVGSTSNKIIVKLRAEGKNVKAFIRKGNKHAAELEKTGAEVYQGDLFNLEDLRKALDGVNKVYFSMSLNPYYTEACALMIEACLKQGHIEHFVNISDYELDYMTYENMSAPFEQKSKVLGPYIQDWSPQQRAHFVCEKMLEHSGLNVTNVRATMFVENPIVSMLPLNGLSEGKLFLPFNDKKAALITSYDVAEAIAVIITNTKKYGGKNVTLTGKKLLSGNDIAEGFSTVLGKKIEYVPVDLDTWTKNYISFIREHRDAHTAIHLDTISRMVGSGFYDNDCTSTLSEIIGREPQDFYESLKENPKVMQFASSNC